LKNNKIFLCMRCFTKVFSSDVLIMLISLN
jgi:hypothetical protein